MSEVQEQLRISEFLSWTNGSQILCGLAGTGKSKLLLDKAIRLQAQSHSEYRDYPIAITYYTRTLTQYFRDMVKVHHANQQSAKPIGANAERVIYAQAWGGRVSGPQGIYYHICRHYPTITAQKFNEDHAGLGLRQFDIACEALRREIETTGPKVLYEAILVDEAQDLPESFLRVCLAVLPPENRRLILAYDEFQRLRPDISGNSYESLVNLFAEYGHLPHTTRLSISRRCPPETLAVAHGIALGIYEDRSENRPRLSLNSFKDWGYQIANRDNISTSFERNPVENRSTKSQDVVLFEQIINASPYHNIARSIVEMLNPPHSVPLDKIMIILFTEYDDKGLPVTLSKMQAALNALRIQNHFVSDGIDADIYFRPHSVAISGVYRTKGLEADLVYVLYYPPHRQTNKSWRLINRNNLYSTMTRGKKWTRVLSTKSDTFVADIRRAFDTIRDAGFRLNVQNSEL